MEDKAIKRRITVKELRNLLNDEIDKGNGYKYINTRDWAIIDDGKIKAQGDYISLNSDPTLYYLEPSKKEN